jgi:hypothetical protein
VNPNRVRTLATRHHQVLPRNFGIAKEFGSGTMENAAAPINNYDTITAGTDRPQ